MGVPVLSLGLVVQSNHRPLQHGIARIQGHSQNASLRAYFHPNQRTLNVLFPRSHFPFPVVDFELRGVQQFRIISTSSRSAAKAEGQPGLPTPRLPVLSLPEKGGFYDGQYLIANEQNTL